MRYSKEHKAATRQQILVQASRHFLEDGIAGTGIAGLMAEAGLTHGGFYAHFASKDDLVAATITSGFGHTRAALAREAAGESGLEGLIRLYLSKRHRDMPGKGCIAAGLSPEIARLPKKVRDSFTLEVEALLQLIESLLPDKLRKPQRAATALAILTGMMGSLQLARAVSDRAFSDRLLAQGIEAALAQAR
jgi:TetR/AcrR family transcriptional repressor of nem operon